MTVEGNWYSRPMSPYVCPAILPLVFASPEGGTYMISQTNHTVVQDVGWQMRTGDADNGW